MRFKSVVLVATLAFAANTTVASNEVLSVRTTLSGGYEAVVTGLRDNVCAYVVNNNMPSVSTT